MVFPDADSGRSLLEREENALARKRQAINAGAKSLEALRRVTAESREALQALRDLGFSQREVADAFGLTRDEVSQLFPRRPRSAGTTGGAEPTPVAPVLPGDSGAAGPAASDDLRGAVGGQPQQP